MARALLAVAALLCGCMGPYVAPPSPDADRDGHAAREDCDDADAAVFPGAPEACDGRDEDCDGAVDEEPTDLRLRFRDIDGDGHGDPSLTLETCLDEVPGWVRTGDDCDDGDPGVHPGAPETCDALDEDCDGAVDEQPADAPTWYPDDDGDGFGPEASGAPRCEAPEGWTDRPGDCDDADPRRAPGLAEVCDDLDNDCDGLSDEDDPDLDDSTRRRVWADGDGDGHGARGGAWITACATPEGYAPADDDCDDTDPGVFPGAVDAWYDGVDADCGGDDDFDADGDGHPHPLDCDDADAAVFPGAVDAWYDGVDADCGGDDDFDADGDTFAAEHAGGLDCDDGDAELHPFALEDPTDGLDNDCDGLVDAADPEPAVALSLAEDGWVTLTLDAPVSVCGEDWWAVSVGADGLVHLDGALPDDGESAAEFCADGPVVAALWDDLDPGAGGEVVAIQRAEGLSVYWVEVPETASTSRLNTFALTLTPEGWIVLDYARVDATDGLAGWSCGEDPSAPEADLSALPDAGGGRGQGAEAAVYEVFTARDNDLDGLTLRLCGRQGEDADGDGWTAPCGDPDDADAAITP